MTQRDREKRLDLVGKLLAKAASVAGTPEADAFTDHAFALVARAGIEDAHGSTADDHETDVVVRHDFAVEGDFLDQRIMLLTRIASVLHCAHAYWLFSPSASTVEVYGVRRHVDRVRVLFDPLMTRMLRQVAASPWSPAMGLSLQDHQTSWMQGFTLSIRTRLLAAELAAAVETGQSAEKCSRNRALDVERAAAERQRQLPMVRRSTYNPVLGRESLAEGYRAVPGAEPQRPEDVDDRG